MINLIVYFLMIIFLRIDTLYFKGLLQDNFEINLNVIQINDEYYTILFQYMKNIDNHFLHIEHFLINLYIKIIVKPISIFLLLKILYFTDFTSIRYLLNLILVNKENVILKIHLKNNLNHQDENLYYFTINIDLNYTDYSFILIPHLKILNPLSFVQDYNLINQDLITKDISFVLSPIQDSSTLQNYHLVHYQKYLNKVYSVRINLLNLLQ